VSERSFSQEGFPIVVAHRGASAEEAENTLEAFERAVAVGADAIEFDVRLTLDGVAVVLHDAGVDRTTDGQGLVGELTLAEVKRLRIRTTDGGVTEVPTLEEALRCLSGRAAVDVEIKHLPGEPGFAPDREAEVEATVRALETVGFVGPVLLSCFNPTSLAHARALAPEIPTGLLTAFDMDAREALAAARDAGHPWVLPFVGMVTHAGPGFPQEAHEAGLRLGTWLADDPADAIALMRTGVDAVATNDPAAIVPAKREAFGS